MSLFGGARQDIFESPVLFQVSCFSICIAACKDLTCSFFYHLPLHCIAFTDSCSLALGILHLDPTSTSTRTRTPHYTIYASRAPTQSNKTHKKIMASTWLLFAVRGVQAILSTIVLGLMAAGTLSHRFNHPIKLTPLPSIFLVDKTLAPDLPLRSVISPLHDILVPTHHPRSSVCPTPPPLQHYGPLRTPLPRRRDGALLVQRMDCHGGVSGQ